MENKKNNRSSLSTGVWIIIILCISVAIFTLAAGSAYTGIENARLTAARASLGHIESVYYLAEMQAEKQGLTPPDGSFENLLKSYDDASSATLPEYEKFVLNAMLETFGSSRDFDFAVDHYKDGGTMRITIYYFPVKGRTDLNADTYYMLSNGQLVH